MSIDKVYTIREAAEKTGLDNRHLMYRIRKGQLKAHKVGWQWVIPEEEVNRLLEEKAD